MTTHPDFISGGITTDYLDSRDISDFAEPDPDPAISWQLPQQQVDSDLTVQAQGHLSRLSMSIQGTAETHLGP